MPKYAPNDFPGVPVLYTHKGGTAISPNGTAVVLMPPAGANAAMISPEGAACYWAVNAATASAASPGYAPQDNVRMIWPSDNIGSVAVFQASARCMSSITRANAVSY